jgi:phage gp46-like protein
MIDLALVETGNGGDLVLMGNSLVMVESIENMPYIATFGGNVGYPYANTEQKEERNYWWGNDFAKNDTPIQITSLLEAKLRDTALTSFGRVEIEQTMKADLQFMLEFVDEINVSATIISDDHINISLRILMGEDTIIKTVKYSKKLDGDFAFDDFNDDFYTSQ